MLWNYNTISSLLYPNRSYCYLSIVFTTHSLILLITTHPVNSSYQPPVLSLFISYLHSLSCSLSHSPIITPVFNKHPKGRTDASPVPESPSPSQPPHTPRFAQNSHNPSPRYRTTRPQTAPPTLQSSSLPHLLPETHHLPVAGVSAHAVFRTNHVVHVEGTPHDQTANVHHVVDRLHVPNADGAIRGVAVTRVYGIPPGLDLRASSMSRPPVFVFGSVCEEKERKLPTGCGCLRGCSDA